MLPIRVGLASRSSSISVADLTAAAAAIGLQVSRDLGPIWDINASVVALSDPDVIPPGVWPVFVVDDTGIDGAAGLHLNDHQQPYALVDAGPTWTLTASHECLEMLVDPSGNRTVASDGIGVGPDGTVDLPAEKFEYLVEVCDPSEDPSSAYLIDSVLVSDFYTPRFFDPIGSAGVRYSFTGKITRPRQVLPGGYLSWVNPLVGQMQQFRWLDPEPSIVDIPGAPAASARRTLRGFVDEFVGTRRALLALDLESQPRVRQIARAAWMARAASLRGGDYRVAGRQSAPPSPAAAQAVLEANTGVLKAAGATKAYVGWLFQNGWITHQRAIVALAPPLSVEAVRARLPARLGGFGVDVRVDTRPQIPGPTGALRMVETTSGEVREEYAVPTFDGEKELLDDPPVQSGLAAARAHKPHVDYQPPAGVSLAAKVFDVASMLLHISPEQGWAQLEPFLEATTNNLTIGLYEWTAPHIDRTVCDGLGGATLKITLDSPSEPPNKREQTEDVTHDDLSGALQTRLSFAWALSGLGTHAPAEAFPTAYHIKVAVQDSRRFWLSSGNWNTSNQPVVDPADLQALQAAIKTDDRDWHVICDCPELAGLFEAYLLADYTEAAQEAAAVAQNAMAEMAAARPAALTATNDPSLLAPRQPPRDAKQFFAPKTISGQIRIKPLLTPDDYRTPILDLIQSTQTRFYMQTQYIHTGGATDQGNPSHNDLIAALVALLNRGVDVRLITSEFQTKPWLEKLQDAGLDVASCLRIQNNVHNKGMVVDSKHCVVSSQNWSAEGTGANRDAGLIIFDQSDAAAYFEEIFLHDWENLASAVAMG